MKNKITDNRKALIALILVMVIICGFLAGAIFALVKGNLPFSDEELVTDAFTEMKKDGDTEFCFHIPKINKQSDKIDEINKEIYDTLYQKYSADDRNSMHYEWATKDNTLSIVVETENIDEQKPDFFVFNVDITEEETLSVSDMCTVFGLSEDEFYNKSRDAVEKYSEREKQYFSQEDQKAYINEIIDSTLSDSNIKEALPFIDENEKLCIIVPAFTPGTKDTYLHMIEFDTGAEKQSISCTTNHDEITQSVAVSDIEEPSYTEEASDFVADIDYDNLVSDAYVAPIEDTTTCYHIPEINIDHPKIDAINKKIYDTVTDEIDIAYDYLPGKPCVYFNEVTYHWAVKNDVLSIIVLKDRQFEGPFREFFAFNISLKTGSQLSVDEMYSCLGLNKKNITADVQKHVIAYAEKMKTELGRPIEGYESRYASLTSIEEINNDMLCFSSESNNYILVTYPLPDDHRISHSLLNLKTFEDVRECEPDLFSCSGPHIKTEPQEPSNDEWKDILTKYYWDGSIQSTNIYSFSEDGKYDEYFCMKRKNFTADDLEYVTSGSYEIKDNKLFLYEESYDATGFYKELQWVASDSDVIADLFVKDQCSGVDYCFYEINWDGLPPYVNNARYLMNTEIPVGKESEDKPDSSGEAEIYTDFLQNSGYSQFLAYESCTNPDNLYVHSLLYDFDSDGTKELFLTVQDKNRLDREGQALYTIRNGKVETLLLENKEFASMGYTRLNLKYDSTKQMPVIEKFCIGKDSSAATFSIVTRDVFTAENSFSEPVVNYKSTWLQLNNSYYTEDIAEIKAQTDLYYIGETHFEFYKIDGEFVEKSEYEKYDSRYTDSLPSELTLKDGTYKIPIK